MNIFDTEIKTIEKENWKKAKGIKNKNGTNSALAERDYSVDCKLEYKICCIKGYFIWWCSIHHQPFYQCKLSILRGAK